MSRHVPWLIAAGLCLSPLSSAQALCIYRGELDARTTLEQEFADAPFVARVRVLSVRNSWPGDEIDTFAGEPWTLYELQVVELFKGTPPRPRTFFTERNSGGFYLERPGPEPVGDEYLLFMAPTPIDPSTPPLARGSMIANYSCGQSKPWNEVTAQERANLQRLRS